MPASAEWHHDYYVRNKAKCIAATYKWRRENPAAFNAIQRRCYHKRRYGIVAAPAQPADHPLIPSAQEKSLLVDFSA
jgi:hypothetical protein